jgi:hypothetical protein
MKARIEFEGDYLLCRAGTAPGGENRIPLEDALLERVKGWASRYDGAVLSKDAGALHTIGAEIYDWLNVNHWADDWVDGTDTRILEVAVGTAPTDWTETLLDLPWEILARGGEYLAANATQPFVVYRSIGIEPDAAPNVPEHSNFAAMFMAAAPRGDTNLKFEAEEEAILGATDKLNLQRFVEESGCIDFLKLRLSDEGPFEAVHLSCHGDIQAEDGPVLLLETPEGDRALTSAGVLSNTFGESNPSWCFCRPAGPPSLAAAMET